MEKVDLFSKPETLPKEVQEVLKKYEECEFDYDDCQNLVEDLEKVGYTCDYYLDAEPFDLRKMMKKGNSYTYSDIENYTLDVGMSDAEFSLEEFGKFNVGQQFLKLEHNEKDKVASFVLTGTMGDDSIYECIYTDFL